ncbi:hypothetical protein SEUCBS139899_003467 [Sporothrix eucalyptigena]|uniref:peptidylprolyl isomerase n=1 Tax=Sporothrix eucalyptigena TaxID=1812306 RepID=A0ABP0AP73_9PEZI
MSNRRGLLVQQPARRPGGGGRSSSSSSVPLARLASDRDLPDHQQLELPLSVASMRRIAEIANRSSNLRVYDTHLKKSAELLREAIGSVNDMLTERSLHLEAYVEKRLEKGRDEPGQGEIELKEVVERLQGKVTEASDLIEKGARATIDRQMELEDEREALRTMAARLERQREEEHVRQQEQEERRAASASEGGRRRKRRRTDGEANEEDGEPDQNGENGGEEDDDEDDIVAANTYQGPPPASAVSLLTEERAVRAAVYAQMSTHQKYALNNDYIAFKNAWHYSMFPDSDIPLADATNWFNAAGEPVQPRPNRGAKGSSADEEGAGGVDGAGDDEDDDLVVQREVISFLCPLSLVTMKDPYRSRVCKHTFEHSAILEYLRSGPVATRNQPKKCPQTGCAVEYTAKDLVPDTEMRRRIQRAAMMERRRYDAAATSDIEGEDGNGPDDAQDVDNMILDASQLRSHAESAARTVKRERFQRS